MQADKNQGGLRALMQPHEWSAEKMASISQGVAKQKQIEEGPLGLGSGFAGNLVGGTGSAFLGAGSDLAQFLNLKGVSDKLDEGRQYFEDRLKPAKETELSWNYVKSPEGLARGTGNALGSLAAIALPALLTDGLSLGATGVTAAARGGALLSKIPGISAKTGEWAARGLMTVPMEAGMEAGNFEKNAVANGMSPSEAAAKSWGVFGRNAAFLAGSNALQFGMLPKLAGSGVSLGRRGLAAGAELGTQAVEEIGQQGIQNEMAGKPYSYNPYEIMTNPDLEEQRQAGLEGALTMAPIVGLGAAGGYVSDRINEKKVDDKTAPNIDEFMQAISGQESGGDYNAYNPQYGASGKYQILPENWGQWAKDAGLSPNAEMTPENQEIVAKNKFLEYYKKFGGDWRKVAEAWYGGEGAVDWSPEKKSRPQAGGNPSLNEYADSVMARLDDIIAARENEKETIPEDFAEGRYWIKQNENVSYEGAQPQTMQALHALSKWFYEKTGTPLVVTAVTNGTHADGEHSHKNGWKIDINDYGGNSAAGSITTNDGSKGYLADELIKYGQSLGLGMNWEVDHIDVSVDGTQWEGEFAGHNFGGYKSEKSTPTSTSTPSAQNENPSDSNSIVDGIIKNLLTAEPNINPTFDVTQDRKLEQNIFPMFVEDKKNNAEETAFLKFLEENKMLNDDGTFKNNKTNRDKLRKEYAEEISEFGRAKVDESYNRFMQNQKSADEKIKSAFEKLVQQ